jgi:D-alanyl-D-alanine carboxypeptidase/D-alanyl-D-alanine-endopeptidase (penicillin-binding protein 4)
MRLIQKKLLQRICFVGTILIFFTSCSIEKKLTTQAKQTILGNSQLANAHVGISIYEPATNKYWYNYQGEKFFIPASNTKIFTCYAAMKNLGDSLVGLKYMEEDSNFVVQFCGDPTFLHPDFEQHPAMDFLKNHINHISVIKSNFSSNRWGRGWAWDDFNADYMAERSAAPIFGNVVGFAKSGNQLHVSPKYFKDSVTIFSSMQNNNFYVDRNYTSNNFSIQKSNKKFTGDDIPFITSEQLTITLLEDSLHRPIEYIDATIEKTNWKKWYSQSTDSMLKIMMHRSDNFYAEQSLLMIGNEKLGMMDDGKTIDTLLKTDLKLLPQKPKWVDGSGLSRYNLMTPQDFVWVLNQIKTEFGWQRTSTIFQEGNSGTLGGYYKNINGKIFAKTGTLSNVVALSGYITTAKGKEIIFSVLVNQHQSSASEIRRIVEQFLVDVIEKN